MKAKEPIIDYAQLDQNGSYNYLDYFQWKFKERVELFKGKVFKMSPAPNLNHQMILANFGRELGVFFYQKPCRVFLAPFDVRLFPLKSGKDQTVVQPDVCVVCDVKKLDKQGCIGAPDLVVEILSPGNSKHELKTKFLLYQEAGVKEYWIVEPSNKTVLVYVLVDGVFMGLKPFAEGEKLTGRLFSDLQIEMAELFLNMM